MKILLVRHAAHDNVGGFLAGRKPGVRLGADGFAQARRLAERLTREKIEAIYTSPRERARETADAIASACGLPQPCVAKALDEIDFGDWSGQDFDTLNLDPGWRKWNAYRTQARTAAGETFGDVQARALAHVNSLAPASCVALVSHADVIKALVCAVLGLSLDAWPRFDIAPASITRLIAQSQGLRLAGLNEVIS